MAKAAQKRGYRYLAVTDHSASHGFGNDVQADELLRQVERVRALNEELDGFTRAGRLRGEHQHRRVGRLRRTRCWRSWTGSWRRCTRRSAWARSEMTKRMMAAMDHPLVDVIGHPTGRKILQREPYAVDVEQLVAQAAETGTMLEINAQPGPARPERPQRAPGGRGRRADRDRLGRAQRRARWRDPLRRRDRAPRLADEGRTSRTRARGRSCTSCSKRGRAQGGYGAAPLTDVEAPQARACASARSRRTGSDGTHVVAHAVALLDRGHRALLLAPGERDQERPPATTAANCGNSHDRPAASTTATRPAATGG